MEILKAIKERFLNLFDKSPRYLGQFQIQCVGADGKIKWTEKVLNGVTNEGLIDILEQYFRTGTNRNPFYIGLIDNTGYSALAAGDTAAQINGSNGWDESVAYSNSTRVAWGPAAAAAGSIANTTPAAFNINGTATIKGVFIVSTAGSAKSSTAGVLWATALFSGGDQAVINGDTLNVTYTVSAS